MYKSTVTGKRQITIPLEVCNKLNITTGNQVEFVIERDKFIFQKVNPNKENICPCCSELVYQVANHVAFEGRNYHIECWYDKENTTINK